MKSPRSFVELNLINYFLQGTMAVYKLEEFNPDPFMEQLNKQGLPWHELFNVDLEL